MYIRAEEITEKSFQYLIGTKYPISSEKFWQEDSESVYYMDGDKNTCLDCFFEEFSNAKDLISEYTMYYITDLYEYALVKD